MTTQQPNWQATWEATAAHDEQRAILALLALNGLSIETIRQITPDQVDLADGWLYAADGTTYPLVSQALDPLKNPQFATGEWFKPDTIQDLLDPKFITEQDAHRRLAGAIWYTSDDGRAIREISGAYEIPIVPLRFTFPFSILPRLSPTEAVEVAAKSRSTLQAAADWLVLESLSADVSIVQRVVGLLRQGQIIFLLSSTFVSGLNLLHNLLMGRLLSPAAYGQLTLLITLQLLVGLLPTTLQTVTARFSAGYVAQDEERLLLGLHHYGTRLARGIGGGLLLLLLLLAMPMRDGFQLENAWLVVPMALAMPFFLMMAVDRGVLQGLGGYRWLSIAYLTEGIVRLGLGLILGYALLDAGRSLDGAVWGVAQSVAATWFISWLALRHFVPQSENPPSINEQTAWLGLGQAVGIALLGQALITNSDFFLVKNLFEPTEAGFYAAISVLGRIAYFGALPITVLIVPLVARQQALGQSTWRIFLLLMGAGGAMCGVLFFLALLFASPIVRVLYGDAYTDGAYLLPTYTFAASLYVLTNLAITYQVALGKGREAWMPLVAGALQIVGILLFHASLLQVVMVQIVLMTILLVAVVGQIVTTNQREMAALAASLPA